MLNKSYAGIRSAYLQVRRVSGSEDPDYVFIGDTVRFLRLTLLAASSAPSTYVNIRLRSLLLAASLSFGIEAV